MTDYVLLFVPVLALMLIITLLRLRPRKPLNSAAPDPFAQERIWAERRRREAERAAENARPYAPEDLSATTTAVSILEYHHSNRDETYTAVYLITDKVMLPTASLSNQDLFDRYRDMRSQAIWSWRDDSQRTPLAAAALVAAAHSRTLAMQETLTEAGWRVSGHDAYSDDLKVTYLIR